MARTPKTTPEQDGEISFTMVKFTMRGSDTSMQKGMDAIKSAFVQAGFIPALPDMRARPNGVRQIAATGSEQEVADEVVDPADPVDQESGVAEAAPILAPKRTATAKKPPNFKIMKDLKFDDVQPTLEAFVAEKKPKTHLDRYLCIAYWFKHYKDLEDLTTEHFFTAYMHYRWTLPANAATPINDLRHAKRQLFVAGKTTGTSTIANSGERQVGEMGKAEA